MKKLLSILSLFLSITFSFAQLPPAQISAEKNITNKSPLQTLLGPNEVFTAGDFPVTVISAQGSNGIYSGTGYIVVPYLADTKIKVSFNNIKLNTDKKLIEGAIETTYDPNESAVAYASAGLGETFGDAGVKEVIVDFPIGGITYSATPPPGKITITGSDGNGGTGSTVDYPGGKDYQFTDSNGNIWTVDENGTVTQGGKVAEGGASNSTNTDGVTGSGNNATVNQYTAKGIKIEWKENAGGQFAYDTQEKTKLPADKYPSVKDADGSPVSVPYKATVNKQTELFNAKVSITDPALKDAKIEFKTLSIGKAIDATEINKTDTERNYQLKLVGAFDYAEEEVIAVLMPKDSKDKQQVISSFRLVHLSPKDINVALVPTDAESKNKLSNIETQTNAIYKKVGVKINFNRDDVFDIAPYLNGNTVIPTEKNTALSTYSSVQQAINKGYGNKNNDRYILFVADRNSDNAGQLGYMRLNGQFGYVFKEGLNLNKTGAHELGHGIFKLEHPFENLGLGEKTTPLLMDYRTGDNDIVLSHLDWKQINDPAFKLYAFQSQSSGQDIDKKFVLSEDGYFITPSNKLIKLTKGTEILFYCAPPQSYQNNVLHGFKTPDGFYWENATQYQLNVKTFDGFYKVKKDKSGWEKDNLGNRILFADTNYNYNGAGKYPVFYILWVNLGNDKAEYRILKGEINITGSQISSNKYFGGTIADVSGASNLPQVDVITSTGCQQMVQDKGELYQTITDPQGKYEIKVFKNKDGKLNVEFKLLTPSKKGLSEDDKAKIEAQTQELMNEKLQKIGSLEGSEKGFTDDFGFYVADMTGKQWLSTIGELGTSVWEDATLPKNYWKEDEAGHKNSTIRTPALFAGVSDGGIDLVSDYPQLVKLGYDVATKTQFRQQLWDGIKNIDADKIINFAEEKIKNKWENYSTDKIYIRNHELGKDGVFIIKMVASGGFISGIKDFGDKIKKQTDELANDAAKTIIDLKFWDKNINFKDIRVFQRDDLFDINKIDELGRSNLERMMKGLAPVGNDGYPINLHHLTQTNTSGLAEVQATFHQKYTSTIHINPKTIPSGIDRAEFNKYRRAYWVNRANDFK